MHVDASDVRETKINADGTTACNSGREYGDVNDLGEIVGNFPSSLYQVHQHLTMVLLTILLRSQLSRFICLII